jgi:ribosomal protein S18 acetylase RimI-like enzyme
MEIRRAKEQDSAGLARVQVDSYQTAYVDIFPQSYLKHFTYEEQERDWRDLLSTHLKDVLYVATTNTGEIVGYALGTPDAQILPYQSELVALHVRGAHQRQGIGSQLFAAVSRELKERGRDSLCLWVLADNPARSFYEKRGGVVVGEKPWQNNAYFDTNLYEMAYGWLDIQSLCQRCH